MRIEIIKCDHCGGKDAVTRQYETDKLEPNPAGERSSYVLREIDICHECLWKVAIRSSSGAPGMLMTLLEARRISHQ